MQGRRTWWCGVWLLVLASLAWGQSQEIIGNRVLQGSLNYCADAGATDAYACNTTPALRGYVTGACYLFKANTTNTGAATLDLQSLGAKTIKKGNGTVYTTDLDSNDICAGQDVTVCYDGTNMQLQSPTCTVGAGNVTASGTLTSSAVVTGAGSTTISTGGAGTLATSLTTPLALGGSAAGSTLTLQSTSGVGTTDSIVLKVGNNGAVTAGTVNTTGDYLSTHFFLGEAAKTISAAPATNDFSNVRYETYTLAGADIAGTPASGYHYALELIPHHVRIFSSAGHNENPATGDGRTGIVAYRTEVSSSGPGGDIVAYNGKANATGGNPAATHFLGSTASVLLNGDIYSGANGTYINAVEYHLIDQGFDAAGIGLVVSYDRTNDTGALGTLWIAERHQAIGNKDMNFGYTLAGATAKWGTGLDFTPATFTATNLAAIVVKKGDKYYFDGTATADAVGIKWGASTVGAASLYMSTSDNAIHLDNTVSTQATTVTGVQGKLVDSHASGTNSTSIGVRGTVSYSGAGPTTTVAGVYAEPFNIGAGTSTNNHGFHAANCAGGGTITNCRGLFVTDLSGGTSNVGVYISQTTGYALFAAGAGVAYFAGKMGLNGPTTPNGPLVVGPPATQPLAEGDTVTDNGCGTLKNISSASAVTTNTTNTFTAPALGNNGCRMAVCNTNATDAITLDKNANFLTTAGANVVLLAKSCIDVMSTGASGVWLQLTAIQTST